jgi:hypothetical protein
MQRDGANVRNLVSLNDFKWLIVAHRKSFRVSQW